MSGVGVREVFMLDFVVDDELCTRCGECVSDCPSRIIEDQGKAVPRIAPDNEANCLRCQHCLAVCPTAAVSILGKKPGDSLDLAEEALPTTDAMELLVRGRRSVRRFREKEVEPELIARLLSAAASAPTGANRRDLTFTLVANRTAMEGLRKKVLEALRAADDEGRVPEHFAYLKVAVPAYFKYKSDLIFRDAPHLLIASAGPGTLCPTEDIPIALASFELLARSSGVGTVWCGMLKMAFEVLPELKALVDLPTDHAYYAMLFGIPAVRYPRTVQRDADTSIRHITA